MKKLKRLGVIIGINAFFILVLVYAFEFFLEWKDPRKRLPPDGMVGEQLVTWGNPVVNNALGFREREFEMSKPPGVVRIMVLGDSLTWGAGLAPEQRYTSLLEKKLNESGKGKFEVLNFGQPAASAIEERDALRKYGAAIQPDLIIIGFCINDPQPKSQNYSIEREQFDGKYGRMFVSIKYRSNSVRLPAVGALLVDAAYGLAEKTNRIPNWAQALDRTYVQSSPEWQGFLLALKDMKQWSDEMKLPAPVFAALNQSGQTGKDYLQPSEELSKLIQWTRQAEKAAGELGFSTLNFEKEIPLEMANDSMVINELDGHPSAKLNEVYARKLTSVVLAQLSNSGKISGTNKNQ